MLLRCSYVNRRSLVELTTSLNPSEYSWLKLKQQRERTMQPMRNWKDIPKGLDSTLGTTSRHSYDVDGTCWTCSSELLLEDPYIGEIGPFIMVDRTDRNT